MKRALICLTGSLLVVSCSATATAQSLVTRWSKDIEPECVHADYPRPQLVRERWLNLNGTWQYAIRPREAAVPATGEFDGQILVPFAVESALSGVKKPVGESNRLWYRRTFSVPGDWKENRILLHFGAVDWETSVFLNGQNLGIHRGGYDPFLFDITDSLKPAGEQELVVSVWDPTDAQSQPRGKQVNKPHGIWYTAVTGIWQTVWLEPVPRISIRALRMSSDADQQRVILKVTNQEATKDHIIRAVISDAGQSVGESEIAGNVAELSIQVRGAKLWSPDSPHLYDVRVEILDGNKVLDSVTSYCGLRKIGVKKDAAGVNRLCLNGQALFQFGPLDQGWWPDGLYTAPSDEALRSDIEVTRQLGFNMCRKHVKVEPERWYYWADKLGLLVWQDMPSGMATGRPHAIPAGAEKDVELSAEQKQLYRREWQSIIDSLYSHPSIVVWVPFNEGWGQHDTNDVLRWTKEYDPTRLVDGPSGWQDRGFGDLKDLHRYPGPAMYPVDERRVSVLGEFGGLGLPLEGHTWLDRDNWGYRTYTNKDELLRNYERLIRQLPGLISQGLAAAVYTQTTDVEVEVNGLLTYDRAVVKMPLERLAKLHQRLYEAPRKRSVLIPTSEQQAQEWRYTTTAPSGHWEAVEYDDASWQTGPGGFGTHGTPNTNVRTTWNTKEIWLRRFIELPSNDQGDVHLRIHHDEDAEVYLNGERIATVTGYATNYFDLPLDAAARKLMRPGRNLLAVHCKQTGGGQYIDVGFVILLPP